MTCHEARDNRGASLTEMALMEAHIRACADCERARRQPPEPPRRLPALQARALLRLAGEAVENPGRRAIRATTLGTRAGLAAGAVRLAAVPGIGRSAGLRAARSARVHLAAWATGGLVLAPAALILHGSESTGEPPVVPPAWSVSLPPATASSGPDTTDELEAPPVLSMQARAVPPEEGWSPTPVLPGPEWRAVTPSAVLPAPGGGPGPGPVRLSRPDQIRPDRVQGEQGQREQSEPERSEPEQAPLHERPAPDVIGRLAVRNRSEAERSLALLLARVGGAELGRRRGHAVTIVDAVLSQSSYDEFARGAARIGAWAVEAERSRLTDEVRVTIRVTQ